MNILALGFFNQITGYGNHTDSFFAALARYCNVTRNQLSMNGSSLGVTELDTRPSKIDATIILAPPIMFPNLKHYAQGIKIGYWACEDTIISSEESESLKYVDKRWVTSHWGQNVLERHQINADVVPEGIDPKDFQNIEPLPELDTDQFKFLCVAQKISSNRKNTALLLRAFQEEFSTKEAYLIWASTHEPDQKLPNMRWVQSQSARKDFVRIYPSCDAFVLPTRTEGWGLPILEAMAAGLPTLAPRYSAITEYMPEDYPFQLSYQAQPYLKDGVWQVGAEVDLDDMKKKMREVFADAQARDVARQMSSQFQELWNWDEAAKEAMNLMQSYL